MSETDVDDPVEDQTDRALAALGVVVAQAVASNQSSDDSHTPMFWIPVLRNGAGLVLLNYLTRVTGSFAARWPTPVEPGTVRRANERAVDDAVERAANMIATNITEGVSDMSAPRTPGDHPDSLRPETPPGPLTRARVDAGAVARAMTMPAREEARFNIATQMGAVYKVWHTREDNRVRVTHAELEGNRVPLSSDFITINLNHLSRPGDPMAPLSETAGCRCRLSYLVPKGDQ